MRRIQGGLLVAALAAVLAACGSSSSSSSTTSGSSSGTSTAASSAPVTLTLWHNYGTEQNTIATQNLVKAYQALHPNVTIKIVSQPAANYFALLQAAAISKTGPDIAVMWTGLFTLQYKSYLQNLKGLVPDSALAHMKGLQWTSDGLSASNPPYVMPLENQFYIGFYNKAAFAKAGLTSVPTTWNELFSACPKLRAAGYIPLVYGNGGQALGAEFYPWYDASYMMIGKLSVAQWQQLYNGQIPWTNAQVQAQFANWTKLHSNGCTNADVLTKTNNLTDFTSGKAAMMVDGTWDTSKFTGAMKSNVAAFVPPFSDTPIKGVVEFPGDGFSIMNYSQHKQAAADFLAFLATPQAVQIVNAAGLIPDVTGSATTNPVNQQMLDFAAKQGFVRYPMLDNVTAVNVVNAGNTILPSVLAGHTSVKDGLSQMQNAWNHLPASQRGPTY